MNGPEGEASYHVFLVSELKPRGIGIGGFNDTERGLVRNNPTQAKRRLEWATHTFVANAESRVFCR
jgi:hypothetical protein